MSCQYSLLFLLCLVIACAADIPSKFKSRAVFGGYGRTNFQPNNDANVFELLRGGSTAEAAEENDVAIQIDEDEDDDADENPVVAIPAKPVRMLIQTNWGNSVLDQRVELMAARTRNIASLKKSLSRLLPGRPPLLGLELVSEGRVLNDDMLVDELFDDQDDDDDDEDNEDGCSKTLILNCVPPVDPKFATELAPRLKAHVEDDDETLSTEDLLEAYFLNQAAMSRNGQLLGNPTMESPPLLRLEVQEQARKFREQLKAEIPEEVWQSSLEPVRRSHHTEEYRGLRYRSGKGGARTNLKKSIQHNMNIHWGQTIQNFLLFLFFGYFGGRNSVSRYLMLWGAPLCFILQARPVKMWSKILFYMMVNPPGIVLSLLPAPQQALLSMDLEKSYAALYSNEEDEGTNTATSGEQASDDEESDVEEFESDEESEDDDDSDEDSES